MALRVFFLVASSLFCKYAFVYSTSLCIKQDRPTDIIASTDRYKQIARQTLLLKHAARQTLLHLSEEAKATK